MLAACGSAMALGQITADGIVDPTYGVPLAIQGVETAYGDSGSGNVLSASGSELSAGYATIRNNTLYVMLAGNLSSNSSRLNVLLDVRTGGQNPLRGDNPITEMDALNRLGSDAINPGMSFFEDIAPDFWVGITTDDSSARVEFVELSGDLTSGAYYDLGFSPNGGNGVLSPGLLPYDFRCVINNSNTAGVAGGTGCAVGGQTALAGVELAIPLAVFNLLAIDVTSINVIAFVGGAANETVSNQCLPTFDCPAGGGDEPRMLQMPAAMPANGMPAMPAARPAGPWFERWRAGGPNDQSAAGLMAPHSGLAATPAAAKFEDRDLAGWAAGLIGCTEFV
ncbi:MAG: hypothetical protein ACKVS9_06540, partial [Phycisphaerae bacterium]